MPDHLDALTLQDQFVELIHVFGVLRSDTTPCGQPMSVSNAHALCELRIAGPLAQAEIAARLGLAKSTVSRLIDQLEAKKWVTRTPDATGDARVRQVSLTPRGEQIADQVLEARTKRFSNIISKIDETKRASVIEAMELLTEAARSAD